MVIAFAHDGPGTAAPAWRADPRWSSVPSLDLTAVTRLVVVAAHPDDETLGAGGLMATLSSRGVPVHVVTATAGERSHPDSPTHTPSDLARRRRQESDQARLVLAPGSTTSWLDLGDGQLPSRRADLATHLVDLVVDGAGTLIVAPWRHDGHPDHEAAGEAAATAAYRCAARLLEYPVWWWHWSEADGEWPELGAVLLTAETVRQKRSAISEHTTQVAPLSDRPGDEVLLDEGFIEHFVGDREMFVVEEAADAVFETLHREQPDPWGVDTRWYERRKRDLTLAALPRERFARGLEIGCSVGALAVELAGRCEHLLAVDNSATALERARRRARGLANVEVRQIDVADPAAWPVGTFDLVVLSEVGYFLSAAALRSLAERIGGALTDDAVVVLCHWRHPIEGWPLDGPAVHRMLADAGLPPVQLHLGERDMEMFVLAAGHSWPDPRR